MKSINKFVLSALLTGSTLLGTSVSAADYLMVVDSSGSMKELTKDGQVKIEAAKDALAALRADLSAHDVGVLVFGHRTDPQTLGSCQDVELVMPISQFDQTRYNDVINSLNPRGSTPLAESLKRAATELMFRDRTEAKTVIVVTDGNETCNGDPIAVASQLRGMGINVKVNVIGFGVKPAEQQQLQELAKAGGGSFGLADTKKDLVEAIKDQLNENSAPKGQPVSVKIEPKLPPIMKALVARLSDASPTVRRTTADTLQKMKGAEATVPYLAERLLVDDEYYAWRSAFYAVNRLSGETAEKTLIEAMQSQNADRRNWAASFTTSIVNKSTASGLAPIDAALIAGFSDKDPTVRRTIAESLQKRGTIAAADALYQRIQNEKEYYAWRSAVHALKAIAQPKAVEAIVEALASTNADIRNWAADHAGTVAETN